MAVIEKTLRFFKCEQCGHEWRNRRKRKPRICPTCKRENWDTPRTSESKAAD